jgi:hypothetical protein
MFAVMMVVYEGVCLCGWMDWAILEGARVVVIGVETMELEQVSFVNGKQGRGQREFTLIFNNLFAFLF